MKECIKQIPGVLVGVFLLGALLVGGNMSECHMLCMAILGG